MWIFLNISQNISWNISHHKIPGDCHEPFTATENVNSVDVAVPAEVDVCQEPLSENTDFADLTSTMQPYAAKAATALTFLPG